MTEEKEYYHTITLHNGLIILDVVLPFILKPNNVFITTTGLIVVVSTSNVVYETVNCTGSTTLRILHDIETGAINDKQYIP